MKYWLTTHWPPLLEDEPTELGAWLEEGKAIAAAGMDKGDLLLVYQVEDGPALKREYADGTTVEVPRAAGRKGIVMIAEITDKLSVRENDKPEHYADGTSKWWRYLRPARALNTSGLVPFEAVKSVVGGIRGMGKLNSGLKELLPHEFDQLREKFVASIAEMDATKGQSTAQSFSFGGTGEGPTHKALKERIASDPSGTLGEAGLTLWKMEHLLPTADRIDVVLTDRVGRFVAVEVEVDCCASEVVGPLQCMKYRAMLAYHYQRPVEQVRAVLVAHSVHPEVVARCKEYNIDCVTVQRLSEPVA